MPSIYFQRLARKCGPALCSDCPPVDYPTDRTRCDSCPRLADTWQHISLPVGRVVRRVLNQRRGAMISSGIDWSTKPPPWCWIGPAYREQCIAIVKGKLTLPPVHYDARPSKPERRHRPAVPPDPKHQAAVAARQAEIASAKAALQIKHDLRAVGVQPNRPGPRPREHYFDSADLDEAAQAIARAADRSTR